MLCEYMQAFTKTLKMLVKFECEQVKACHGRRGEKFNKNHMTAAQVNHKAIRKRKVLIKCLSKYIR